MNAASLICILATLSGLIYVFYLPGKLYLGPGKTRLAHLREHKEVVYENLRDLNFEYKAGKLGDIDYESLKSSLEEEAAAVLAEIANVEQTPAETPSRKRRGVTS